MKSMTKINIVITQNLEETFESLYEAWKFDTSGMSNPRTIFADANFYKIVGLGEPVLPLIFKKLKEKKDFPLTSALRYITRCEAGNILADNFGTSQGFVDSWIEWGKEHGYIDMDEVQGKQLI